MYLGIWYASLGALYMVLDVYSLVEIEIRSALYVTSYGQWNIQ